MKKWKQYLSAGLCVVLMLGMTACGAASDSSSRNLTAAGNGAGYKSAMVSESAAMADYGYAMDSYEVPMAEQEYASRSVSGGTNGAEQVTQSQSTSEQNTARKLIRNANLSVETKEFDAFLTAVENKVNELGGYIESMDTYNGSRYSYNASDNAKYSNLTVRIPQKQMNAFLDAVSEAGNVTNRGESVEDVTLTYVDMESRKKALQTELDRLQSFLEKAETLEDIITLEDRMSNVRYQLESMESQLRTYDNMVDYSTVCMNIREVKELTPVVEEEETNTERLVNGFKESLEDIGDGFVEFFIWFVIHVPYMAVFAVIVLIILLIVKGIRRRSLRKNAAKQEKLQKAAAEKAETQTVEQKK